LRVTFWGQVLKEIIKYAISFAFLAACLLPFIWIVGIALKTKKEFYQAPFTLPENPQCTNFVTAWRAGHFGQFFPNSVILAVSTAVGVVICSTLAGYAFAWIDFWGKEGIFYLFLVGMMIPFQAIMIPLYYELRDLRLLKTYFAGILPLTALGLPFGIFLMRAFFRGLPRELADAAKIDGCNDINVLWWIMLPMAQSSLITLTIVQFIGAWNSFLIPLLYMQQKRLRPLTLGLLYFQTRYVTDYTMVTAGVTITVAPMILVYLLFQNQIVKGLTTGALKG